MARAAPLADQAVAAEHRHLRAAGAEKGQLHRPPLKVLLRKAVDVAKIRQPRLQRGVIPVPPLAAFDTLYQRIVEAHADLLAATPATML